MMNGLFDVLEKIRQRSGMYLDCPKIEDYPIFFTTSEKSSKDNFGESLCKIGEDGKARLDNHGHLVIDHDSG